MRPRSNSERLLRIEASHFVAGAVVYKDYIRRTAPILYWATHKPQDFLLAACRRNGWSVMTVLR